ncbi:LIM/homeobox protein Awh isoform X3 [Rhopalosiphum maidis]|uniref:LIM/homeobox protein Awh isoform X3 n=1 Tax=Rhopalosiphum maidis TaxID=43146 RepID=UPI000EFE768C|nr:LIM/homeobox protein Awh isoform X3 [Rhopalosiphum maidis]
MIQENRFELCGFPTTYIKNMKTESLQCRGCSDPITDRFLLKVSDKIWHVSCLRCCVCNLVLEDEPSCFIKDDSIYCRQDYARSFGTVCSKCSKGISASHWVRKARDHVYHLACFRCDACDRQLNTGEEFALHEGRVLCKPHYLDIVDGGTTSSSEGGDSESYHSKNKAKRVRTTFTEEQLQVLQANFQLDSNPDGQDLERIAQITGLSKRVTQVWFQNSRARQKKHLHTGKVKSAPSGLLHHQQNGSENHFNRHINLHLTYSFQQPPSSNHSHQRGSPIYIPQNPASETSSLDDLSQDSIMMCSVGRNSDPV